MRPISANKVALSVNNKMLLQPRKYCMRAGLGLCAVLTICLLLFCYIMRNAMDFTRYELMHVYPVLEHRNNRSSAPRTILLWNKFFGSASWNLPADTMGPADFRDELNCRVDQCELTNQHDFLPDITMFDAIVFHVAEMFPIMQPVPQRRHAQQLYVFALMEPPTETKHVLSDEYGFYNLTMTYRLDADVLWPYMVVADKATGQMLAPSEYVAWRQPPTTWHDNELARLWQNKTKMAAWFVSHCTTYSSREKLAKELQQYLAVDIYGKCGQLSLPYDKQLSAQLLDTQYKFYLSFENALCNDYVTEKFYNALERFVIPIVFGGANYTKFAPPHSYINAEDFDSVQELATYLNFLSTNAEQYMRYFWWRQYYRIEARSPYCQLCELLHSSKFQHSTQTYLNIEQWWMAYQCRTESKVRFGNQ